MQSYRQDDRELKRSLSLVVFALSFGVVFFTIFGAPVGSPLFTGFMRALGAGDLVFSIVMALPVLGAVMQVFGSYFMELTGRRRFLFLASGLVQRLSWVPVGLLPLFMGVGLRAACIWVVTVFVTLSSVASSVNGMAFNSWMGDLVPGDIIGRFFGKRTLVSTISGAVAGLAVGAFVDKVNTLYGFAIVFVIGSLFGVVDVATFFWVKHPPFARQPSPLSLRDVFLLPFRNRNYIKMTLFVTIFNFGVNVPAPFFNVYMIEQLKMSYFVITLSNQIMTGLTTVLFVHRWGVMADRYGNRPVVLLGAMGIITLPFLWMFTSPTHYGLVYLINLAGGIAWSAYNLAVFNQSVWMAPEKNRSAYIACFTLLTSVVGVALAYVCGGLFMQFVGPRIDALHIPFVLGRPLNSFQVIFCLSSVIRLIALLALFPMVHEEGASSVRHLVGEEVALMHDRFAGR